MLTLAELIEALTTADIYSNQRFCYLINQSVGRIVTLRELAKEFSISFASVYRWGSGLNAPHPHMREPIYKYLADRAREKQSESKTRFYK